MVHPPLRSRCVYTKVRLPTDLEEVRILHSRVPVAKPTLLVQVIKMVRYIRVMMPTVRDKPGLRESIALLKALQTEGAGELTAELIDDHLGFIARNADRGPRCSWHGMRTEADCLNKVYHRIDFRCRCHGFHYD